MADGKKAMEMYKAGLNCGQIVASFCSETCGFDEMSGRAALGGFGMGIHLGEVCGAIVGGIYSLGMYCNHCDYNDDTARYKITRMTSELTSHFLDTYGSICCRDLTSDGNHHRCWELIEQTNALVKDIVTHDKAE